MVNIRDLIDDAKCFETVRAMRWPEGVTCPKCSSASVVKNGRDESQPDRQRYEPGMLPQTDDLVNRAMSIGIGVADLNLGSSFGVTVRDGADLVHERAERFCAVASRHLT